MAVFSVDLVLPGDCSAIVTYGTQISYQQNETDNGTTKTSTTQERFKVLFDMNTRPFSELSLRGRFSVEVLQDTTAAGSESSQLQPDISFNLSTKAVNIGAGFRDIIRDEVIISGVDAKNLSSESSEIYVESSYRFGNLPYIRLRYGKRELSQDTDGVITQDFTTDDIAAGLNYALGIFSLNANYSVQSTDNRLDATTGEQTQINGQARIEKDFGKNINVRLREDYNYSKALTNGLTSSERTSSATEARVNVRPVERAVIDSSYIYRVTEDLVSTGGQTLENNWVTRLDYAFPKLLRLYGSYSWRDTDAPDRASTSEITIGGLNLSHIIGKFRLSAKYERRIQTDSSVSTDTSSTSESEILRDSVDWAVTARLSQPFAFTLSESLIVDDNNGKTNETNRFRLKLSLGPVKNVTASPFIDYTITTPADTAETINTQFVLPASFRVDLFKKLTMDFTENYTWMRTEREDSVTVSQTNSSVIRLNLVEPLPGMRIAMDASFANTDTDGLSSSRSSYTFRLNWLRRPHTVNMNLRYQVADNTDNSGSLAFQYGLNVRLQNIQLSLQARYDYTITYSNPESTSQGVYVTLSARR